MEYFFRGKKYKIDLKTPSIESKLQYSPHFGFPGRIHKHQSIRRDKIPEMFERKLLALGYDRPSVDPNDQSEFRNLIHWLESSKIRFYPPNDRNCLVPDSSSWDESFDKYLNEIGYQGKRLEKNVVLDWLLNVALRYEMEDTRTAMKFSQEEISDMINENIPGDFSNLDLNSMEFLSELKELADMLNVPFYEEEPLCTLRAIAILLCKMRKSNRDDGTQQTENSSQPKKQKIASKVDENILNMPYRPRCKYDAITNRCANVMRLLYVKDLRELQTNVNQVIVLLQSVTANPKTDSSLGQVGR